MTADEAARVIVACLRRGGKVLVCGNGGSLAEAMHFAGELVGAFMKRGRPGLPAIALCDPVTITAIANDYGFERVFERMVDALGGEGDVLLALSTSGNSENVLRAVTAALARDMVAIGLSGGRGGQMGMEIDAVLCAPVEGTPECQEWHLKVLHDIARLVEQEMFPDGA